MLRAHSNRRFHPLIPQVSQPVTFPGRIGGTTGSILLAGAVLILCVECQIPDQLRADARESSAPQEPVGEGRTLYLRGLEREATAEDESAFGEAAELYWQSAVAGDPQGMLEWGNSLMAGQGVAKDESAAVAWYLHSAESGCAEAAMNLGWYFSRDLDDESRVKQAREWYHRAESLGFMSASYSLRALDEDLKARSRPKRDDGSPLRAYERLLKLTKGPDRQSPDENRQTSTPHGDKQAIDEALRQIQDAAEAGDRNAMTDLGMLYSRGELLDKNDDEAVRWWRRAAELGDPWAHHDLGWAYATGRGVERDLKIAFQSYFRAADQGNARALWEVGLAYLEGRGVKQDEAAAAHCFRRAAEGGDPHAMAAMGQLYFHGSKAAGIDRDVDVACDWYLMATAHGDEHSESAARSIAKLPESSFSRALQGDRSPAQETISDQDQHHQSAQERFAELEHRAAGGDVRAAIMVAAARLEGTGTERNPKVAFETFRKHAATEPDARAYLAQCYAEGAGVSADRGKSAELLESAAAAGSPEAMYHMGRQSISGLRPDPLAGLTWFQKAAAKGHPKAMYELGLAWKEGRGVQRDERQAIAWFLQAGNSGSPEGALEVARSFDAGNVLQQSPAKALSWYHAATRLGDKSAAARAEEITAESEQVGAARAAIAMSEIRAGHILTEDVPASQSDRAGVPAASKSSDLASTEGDPEFRLGNAYREGHGVVQEPALASFWLSRAVNKVNVDAHVQLATLCLSGVGMPQDKPRGEKLLLRAVEAKSPSGMYELANLYYGHDPRFRDRPRAMELFVAAAEGGNIPARRFLGKASRYGLATICDGGQARRWWLKAAESGDPSSMLSLGELREAGFGVPRDLADAACWYRQASEHGLSEARTPLLRVQGQLRAAAF